MPKKVLIVDDEDHVRRLVRATLDGEDLEFFEAADGEEGVRMAREVVPDLIILDVMMPGKLGYDVCGEVKSDPRTRHAFVLFLSARDRAIAETTSIKRGGDDFMVKPFRPAELRSRVRRALMIA